MTEPNVVEPAPLRWLDRATLAANVCGSLLIVGLTLLIGLDVAGRNLMNAPIPGVPEMVSLSIVAIVFLQAPQSLRSGRMTRSDSLIKALSARAPRLGRVIETVFDLAAIAVVGAIVYATWPILVRAWEMSVFVGAVGNFTAPVWPVKVTILLGGSLLVLQFAARILRRFGSTP
ncbi:TRAP transporter small permease subunit [Wenxinia saemankumensis]|uniref:TRAP transporter small permease protein n=1 Tax=Wenxinia saemankumensis TaxID=1447782 RepID=A0A1M6I1W0_9RHOB|nr:TRAP transporter small permease subunit [Wenxinia saemankumensis]SHJ28449.1 TRAP-type mannitol/chloroaromatic compound transport system, small permease component [Wenxinia saemankumensis]